MNALGSLTLCGIVSVAACSPAADTPANGRERAAPAAADAPESCDILTAADVQSVTGASVQRIERNPAIGAGGTCVNVAAPTVRPTSESTA